MKDALIQLQEIISEIPEKLKKISDKAAAESHLMGEWTPKQKLGHMIDQAVWYHHLIIQLQQDAHFKSTPVDFKSWVELQHYNTRDWNTLIQFWLSYNQHLHYIIEHADIFAMNHKVQLSDEEILTMDELINHYVNQLQKGLQDILNGTW